MPIVDHPCHIQVEDNAVLWRYMSFEKYESLLRSSSLFFCRADKFSDPYECSIPRKEYDFRISPQKFYQEESMFNRDVLTFDLEKAIHNSKAMSAVHKKVKVATTVNCWHMNNNESDAMWQLYLKNNEGVAVRTTTKRLHNALNSTNIKIGFSKVRYINYDTDVWYHPHDYPVKAYNFIIPIIHKRIEFSHENELRLYHYNSDREAVGYWSSQKNQMGEFVDIDIFSLVESIVFHPTASSSVKDKIISITKQKGYSFSFESSRLSTEPLF